MMSPNKNKKGAVAIRESSPEPGPSTSSSKRGKRSRMSSDDEEDWVPKSKKAAPSKFVSKSKRSPGFNSHNKPAELFRKDLISAMKLPDSEPLQEGSYFLISDPWRQEWEKGVQVPVNMKEILQADVREIREKSKTGDFKIPHKLLHERVDSGYKKGQHELTGMQQLAEQLVRYDLDDADVCWLEEVNFRRREVGLVQINEWNMERVMEALENQCHEKMTAVMKTEQGMGIEYDEDIVCDVCCSPDSEDTNEMVFCDGCDVCIHQACYGIQSIPEGSWLCRTCALGIKPNCMLCPKEGGAMKSTKSGTKWAHVSCALWIPEVSIGIPEKMEPITKISNIPPSRWALVCCLCKVRVGACIQCSVKTCKTAFHVTCGFSNGLEMKTVLDETDESDGVKLKAYCPKHTKKRERGHSESDSDSPHKDSPPTPKKEMTQQERDNLRAEKLKSLEEDFHCLVDVQEVCESLQLDFEIVDLIYVYWKLKRKCNRDKPLLTPKTEEADILERQQEDSLVARMKMFVHLRQDLERVRNLCYMIGKREKTKRLFFRSKEYVFTGMVRALLDRSLSLSNADVDDIVHNYHFDSIYDDYGLSVPNLPPEPTQDEEHLDDMDMKEERVNSVLEEEEKAHAVDSQPEMEGTRDEIAEEKHTEEPSVVEEEEEEEEDPNEALPPGERWSGEFVRSGFFKRRRPKKWMKGMPGKGKKRKLPHVLSSPDISVPAVSSKPEKTPIEDDNVFTSNDESDEDKEKLAAVVKAIVDKSDDDSDLPQPALPKLVVKSPKSKSFPHRHPRHRKRHRGRKPWHLLETFQKNIQFSSSEDEDMKVKPIAECKKESHKLEEYTAEGGVEVNVVGDEDSTVLQNHVTVNVESHERVTGTDTFLSAHVTQLDLAEKDLESTPLVSDRSKKERPERSVQIFFDQVRKESEQAKSLPCCERTKSVTENAEHAANYDDTKLKSLLNKQLDNLKKTDSVNQKEESHAISSNLCIESENSMKSDHGSKSKSRKSDHKRKSGKSKSKSGSAEKKNAQDEKKNAQDDKTCAEITQKADDDSQTNFDRSEEKRKKEVRHKHHESSSSSRRSKRDRHKSKRSDKHSSSPSRHAHSSSASEGLGSNQSAPHQNLGLSDVAGISKAPEVQMLPNFDDNSARRSSDKDETDLDVSKSTHQMKEDKEETRKKDVFEDDIDNVLLSSGVRDVDTQRSRKGRELSDKEKHKARDITEPFKGLVKAARRRSSSSGHSNIFERMELGPSSGSVHSSCERSNIFESIERHCRQSSLDLGLAANDAQQSESLKSQPVIDWPNKVEFHLGGSDEATKVPQPSDDWSDGESSKNRKMSGSVDTASFDNALKADTEEADKCEASESAVGVCDLQGGSSPIHVDADKASDTSKLLSDKTPCLSGGDGPCGLQEEGLGLAGEDDHCLVQEEEVSLSSGDAPCLTKVEGPCRPVESVQCSPIYTAPCLPNETVLSAPSEKLSSVVSEETTCLPSENVPFVEDATCLHNENVPSLPNHDEVCLPSEPVLPHQTEDVSEDGVNVLPEEVGENSVCDMDKVKSGSEDHLQVESEHGNTVENSLQVSTNGNGDVGRDLGQEADTAVEMTENDWQIERKDTDSIENELQVENEGVNENNQKTESGSQNIQAQTADYQNGSPDFGNIENSDAGVSFGHVEDGQPISVPYSADASNCTESSEKLLQQSHDILKSEPMDLPEFSSRQHSKRIDKMEGNIGDNRQDVYNKNACQPDVVYHKSSVLKPFEKSQKKSSVHLEEQVEYSQTPVARIRHCRKSSHEARLKMSKALATPENSSDDDFEPSQPVMTTFSRRQKHRHNKKLEVKRRGRNMSSEDMSEGEDSDEEDSVERYRRKRRRIHLRENRDKSLQTDFVAKTVSRTCTDNLQPDLSKLFAPSDLIVGEDLVRRVEDRVLRRFRPYHHHHQHHHHSTTVNGTLEDKPKEQKMTQFGRDSKRKSKLILKDSSKWLRSSGDGEMPLTKPLSKTRVLNEITPERSGNLQTNAFGAHYTPRGSLSGYKIPKKSSSQSAILPFSSSPQCVPLASTVSIGSGVDKRSSLVAAPGSQDLSCQVEGGPREALPRKTVGVPDGAGGLEATSSACSEQMEVHPVKWDDYRESRSGSPVSEVSLGVVTRHSDSRESTPRRCTRSQLAEELVNSPPSQGMGTNGSSKMKLRDGWLKASNFPS